MAELKYQNELKRAMEFLAQNDKVIFLGQTVGYPGSRFTYKTLESIAESKRIEMPVSEELQMGISTGLALKGYTPVSIYPRFDFLLLAANQLVNHLDKMEEMSYGEFKPKVIIRAVVGSKKPIDPGPQHSQDHTEAFKSLLTNIYVKKLSKVEEIFPEYKKALHRDKSSLLIEIGDYHFTK